MPHLFHNATFILSVRSAVETPRHARVRRQPQSLLFVHSYYYIIFNNILLQNKKLLEIYLGQIAVGVKTGHWTIFHTIRLLISMCTFFPHIKGHRVQCVN